MTRDTLGEMLTCIRNAVRVKSSRVKIPKTRITEALAKILCKEGLIRDIIDSIFSMKKEKNQSSKFQKQPFLLIRLKYYGTNRVSVITSLQRISRSSLRIYTSYKTIPKILGGLGLIILSTSNGFLTDREARYQKSGGEILCSIWLFKNFFCYFYENSFFGKKNLRKVPCNSPIWKSSCNLHKSKT